MTEFIVQKILLFILNNFRFAYVFILPPPPSLPPPQKKGKKKKKEKENT